jgi:hypothetical protein
MIRYFVWTGSVLAVAYMLICLSSPLSSAQPVSGEPQVYDLTVCQGIQDGEPVGVTRVFPQDAGKVLAWFRFTNVPIGTVLTSVWSFGQGEHMEKFHEASAKVQGKTDWGLFSLNVTEGRKLPAGDYRIDIYLGAEKLASVPFRVE